MLGAESNRRHEADTGAAPWRAWGPYLAERAWGTVREDFSATGASWDYLPHDHARSRTYRWSEDGLAGICDEEQTFCFGLALWNGRDSIVKERIFGLSGPEGNHGEDAKEYWWYLDSTPTHSWMRWRYHYTQEEYPYADLVLINRVRNRTDPEFSLAETGVFDDDRYWAVTVDYAKATPTDMCVRITVANRGPRRESLHLLPTLWFRNTWVWDLPRPERVPSIRGVPAGDGGPARLVADHDRLGRLVLTGEGTPTPLACDNQTNERRLTGGPSLSAHPKDAINDYVVHGLDSLNPEMVGTKAALHYVLDVPAGEQVEIRLRLARAEEPGGADLGGGFAAVMASREAEADEFFASLTPPGATPDEARVLRQAYAGLMWSKQFFHFDVGRWLDGDPTGPPVADSHRYGRNAHWRHMRCHDVMLVPDPWEYPWFAAWDLAFHCVAMARVDATFAKQQVLLLLEDRYMHRSGQLPAYEWAFDDVNPPVHAWAALRVFAADGSWDLDFLERALHKLLLNLGWWVNRKDPTSDNVFEGGFLGLDNIAPFDRSAPLPIPGELDQADATAWMAMYTLNLMEMALILVRRDAIYGDLALRFLDHYAAIAAALYDRGLWDPRMATFCDVLRAEDGTSIPLAVRSLVGLLPLVATSTLSRADFEAVPGLAARIDQLAAESPTRAGVLGVARFDEGGPRRLLSVVDEQKLARFLAPMFDEEAFLSPYGIRSVSAEYRDAPYRVKLGETVFSVPYEPGESTEGTFGGNSNWRGPIWFPINYLLIEALREMGRFYGAELLVEYPTGSGVKLPLGEVADDLAGRLVSLFLDRDGRRPVFGASELFARPEWHDLIAFSEFFHGDTGVGLGASHQTGWTALVAELLISLRERRSGGS